LPPSALRSSESLDRRPIDAGSIFGIKASRGDLGMVKDTQVGRFYQQRLPKAQVPFTSKQGRKFFREALEAGYAENFFFLAEQFRTQDEPTFCGLTTLAMVLNSLRIDPMRTWKGAWRWFNEQNLGCCTGTSEVREEGLTFDMFRRMASCNGANVEASRAPSTSEGPQARAEFAQQFREAVKATSSSEEREFLVICYCRRSLGQTGGGHFSPVGGYHEESDSVLVMDVARFKYPMHWVPLEVAAEAMSQVDPSAGLPRGFLKLRAHPTRYDPRHTIKPLHVMHVPTAAGRRLAAALAKALEAPMPSVLVQDSSQSWAAGAMCRWLQAASLAEPQVLRALFKVGDSVALQEVIDNLERSPVFVELRDAYQSLLGLGLGEDFPPLRFTGLSVVDPDIDELDLSTCGELWILLLLLLPRHLRASVDAELAEPWVSSFLLKYVRGPWALPLEALREILGDLLQPPQPLVEDRHYDATIGRSSASQACGSPRAL
jgi:glutathione gamma-glutamylcysteinyltransferase